MTDKNLHANGGIANMAITFSLYFLFQYVFGLRHPEAAHFNAIKALDALLNGEMPMLWHSAKRGEPRPILVDSVDKLLLLVVAAQYQAEFGQDKLLPNDMSYETFRRACRKEMNQLAPDEEFNAGRAYFACQRYLDITGVMSPRMSGVSPGDAHMAYIAESLGISLEEARLLDRSARDDVAKWLGHKDRRSTNYYL